MVLYDSENDALLRYFFDQKLFQLEIHFYSKKGYTQYGHKRKRCKFQVLDFPQNLRFAYYLFCL